MGKFNLGGAIARGVFSGQRERGFGRRRQRRTSLIGSIIKLVLFLIILEIVLFGAGILCIKANNTKPGYYLIGAGVAILLIFLLILYPFVRRSKSAKSTAPEQVS
ncbi:MAG: hypothetical protein LBG88_01160 [Christensenellaceae bacterium]|jgi:uncharacterized membrane protein|nr:hypothetical protein [Christensenellaceae bacterium]